MADETTERTNNGKPIPNPKNKKFDILAKKFVTKSARVKNAAINAGLQGMTIAPKKNPNINALSNGFLAVGA